MHDGNDRQRYLVQPVMQRLGAIAVLMVAVAGIALIVEASTEVGIDPAYYVFVGLFIAGSTAIGWRALRAGLVVRGGYIHLHDILRHRTVSIATFIVIRQEDWALGTALFVVTEEGRIKVPFSSTSGLNPPSVKRRMAKWAAERTEDIQQIRDGHSAP